ncbi:hypothetical protein RB2150_11981 [Rhodobacteraceae bacterium HTCC2150]|nr:hypothetical protein RB2150_11981 [Rhodobacteraceae bacterium HTCC2150]
MSLILFCLLGACFALLVLFIRPKSNVTVGSNVHETTRDHAKPRMLVEAFPKELLKWITEQKNLLAWVENSNADVIWASPAIADELTNGSLIESAFEILRKPCGEKPGHAQFRPSASKSDPSKNFEVTNKEVGNQTIFLAVETSHASETKSQMSNFVQTLTNTFALLSTGLAIFDRNRQLVMFNPALGDLTRIDPAWLTRKPTLDALLERMRNDQTLGEPKDFKTWRESLPNLVKQAVNGTYEEIWTLATGETLRVVGRPHPHGAIVLLFEDISSEVSADRRQRLEVEVTQNALDTINEAISIFSHDGEMLTANKPFVQMFDLNPFDNLEGINIIHATKTWAEFFGANPIWGDTREFVTDIQNRVSWHNDILFNDKQTSRVRFVPMPNGTTLVGFSLRD